MCTLCYVNESQWRRFWCFTLFDKEPNGNLFAFIYFLLYQLFSYNTKFLYAILFDTFSEGTDYRSQNLRSVVNPRTE